MEHCDESRNGQRAGTHFGMAAPYRRRPANTRLHDGLIPQPFNPFVDQEFRPNMI
jgi:hypothetical protein